MKVSVLALAVAALGSAAVDAKRYNNRGARDPKAVLNVHVVPHTHDDTGWLKTIDQYYTGSNNTIQHAGVQYVIDDVVFALLRDPERKFSYVEQAFFQRWWEEQDEDMRDDVRMLVREGRLVFINGGWTMHDEATTHYVGMVDHTTLGHSFIKKQFNKVPRIGWQVDPFGHSTTQATLLSAEAGFDALYMGRIDYQDRYKRIDESRMEFVWRPSKSLGQGSQVFTGVAFDGNYGPPPGGFCFDTIFCGNHKPINDNPDLDEYNLDERLETWITSILREAETTLGNDVMLKMGSDFQYENANIWFKNMDKLIHYSNLDGRINCFYSTPEEYTNAKLASGVSWEVNTDDFFPYADLPHAYWTGFFVSRPSYKLQVRKGSTYLQTARQLEVFSNNTANTLDKLWRAVALSQHHDGVSGTAKQHVTYDYQKRISIGHDEADTMVNAALDAMVGGTGGQVFNCQHLNETVCPATLETGAFATIVYNPQARDIVLPQRVPVPSASATVYGPAGEVVPSQVVPVEQFQFETSQGEPAPFEVVFNAQVPAVGHATYFVQPAGGEGTQGGEQEGVKVLQSKGEQQQQPSKNKAPIVIENAAVRAVFDTDTGSLQQIVNKRSGVSTAITQDWFYYKSFAAEGGDEDRQNSGTYIFRPRGDAGVPIAEEAPKLTLSASGDVVQEVTQEVAPWVNQVFRLYSNASELEIEYTVGPIPKGCVGFKQTGACDPNGPREPEGDRDCQATIPCNENACPSGYCLCGDGTRTNLVGCTPGGHEPFQCKDFCEDSTGKEVVTRFRSDLSSGDLLYTDSNGRDMMERKLNFRETWDVEIAEPIAGNYYPINAAAMIKDSTRQLSLVTDRSQGGASLNPGELEVMVHRRLIADDGRGVGEPLDETESITPYPNPERIGEGLIMKGKHWLALDSLDQGNRHMRQLMDDAFATPALAFTPTGFGKPAVDSWIASHTTRAGALSAQLPASLQLVTLQALPDRKALLRIAHQYAIDEDADLSKPVEVDLATIFTRIRVNSVEETTITGNQSKQQLRERRAKQNLKTVDDELTIADEYRLAAAHPPLGKAMTVTIAPMEVRTFEITYSLA